MQIKLRRNRHNLSHYHIGTCDLGELIPVGLTEVCPGDTFNHRISTLTRFLPMNAPPMHRVQTRVHQFYVPFRIIWAGFLDYITRDASTSVPTLSYDIPTTSFDRLAQYFGVPRPMGESLAYPISALPFAAYNAIYNEWYRDKDLIAPLEQEADEIAVASLAVRRICWQKDYFTSARVDPQKGPDITFPITGTAPVLSAQWQENGVPAVLGDLILNNLGESDPGEISGTNEPAGSGTTEIQIKGEANLTDGNVTALVTAFRRASRLQALAERYAQFGSDYKSILASMGVKSSDSRLQKPEYLGGCKVNLSFSEVLQTGEGANPVGELRGHGIAPGSSRPYRRFFEEHGYVISLLSVRPQAIYSTALPRHFMHGAVDGVNDFYTPELERIGQTEIFSKEIFPGQGTDEDPVVFGYNDKYAEYKHQLSHVVGELAVGQTLDYWTWARGFAGPQPPALNQTFVECAPDERVFATETGHNVIFAVNHTLMAQRMMTKNPIGRVL